MLYDLVRCFNQNIYFIIFKETAIETTKKNYLTSDTCITCLMSSHGKDQYQITTRCIESPYMRYLPHSSKYLTVDWNCRLEHKCALQSQNVKKLRKVIENKLV